MTEYFNNVKYRNRLDCIYNLRQTPIENSNYTFYLERNDNNFLFHPKLDITQHYKDELGKYVLLSNSFAYFGKNHKNHKINSQAVLDLIPKKQERKHYSSNDKYFRELLSFLMHHWDETKGCIKANAPTSMLKKNCKGCRQK